MPHSRLILDRYRPMGKAGAGGFGTVQVAWDTRIQRKVAIKCIELSEADVLRSYYEEAAGHLLPEEEVGDAEGPRGREVAAVEGARGQVVPAAEESRPGAAPEARELHPAPAPEDDLLPWEDADWENGTGHSLWEGEAERLPWEGEAEFESLPWEDSAAVRSSNEASDLRFPANRAEYAEYSEYTEYAGLSGVDGETEREAALFSMPLESLGEPASTASPASVAPKASVALRMPVVSKASAASKVSEEASETNSAPFVPQRSLANIPGLDEARTAAMLSDASIVTVYDFEVQGNTAYLIMEYVEGITLTRFLRERANDVTLDVVAAVFSSVAHALEVAHANQVLHLDIKPDNVLINRQGQVKVTDFGLATLADASGCGTTGGGTIGYMPLEQMRQESLDARCDEWALASLTYEMLTGKNPFLAPTLEQAEAVIEDAELVLPSLCWDDMDEDIDDVLFFALDPDREERYGSVAEFAKALEPFLGDAEAGRKRLAALVGDAEADEEDEVEERPREPRVPWAERVSDRAAAVLARVFSVAGVSLVSVVAAVNLPWVSGWDSPLLWGLVALCVVGTVFKPHLGALMGFVFLGVSAVCSGAPLMGVVLVAATVAWWWFIGRGGNRQACAALAQPLLGAVGLAPVAPLMAGCFLGVRDAAATAAYSVVTAFAMSGYAARGAVRGLALWDRYDVLSAWSAPGALPNDFWVSRFPGVDLSGGLVALGSMDAWCTAASWILAALVFSLFCLRGTKAFDVAGSVFAVVVLVAGACAAAWLAASAVGLGASVDAAGLAAGMDAANLTASLDVSSTEASPSATSLFWRLLPSYLVGAVVAGVLAIAAAIAGIPDRVRWEEEQESDIG